MEVRLQALHALRQTSSSIKIIEKFQATSSDGINVLRCLGRRDLLAVTQTYVLSVTVREISDPSAVSSVMRVRAQSKGIPVSRTERVATENTMVIASPVLLPWSTESVVHTAVLTTVDGARAVTGDNSEKTIPKWRVVPLRHRRRCLRCSRRVRKKPKNAAPTDCCSTSVDEK